MQRGNGTGPLGNGVMTGRGIGPCNANARRIAGGLGLGPGFLRLGYGCRRGYSYFASRQQNSQKDEKQLLQERKELLENKLNAINKALENL